MASTTFIVGDQPDEVNGGSTPLQVEVTITEVADVEGGSGTDLQVTLEVVSGYVADLRAFFFNVADPSLLASLQVDGADVANVEAEDNAVISADPPGEPNINPLGPFDVGVEIGSQGIGADDIQSTTFIISAGDTDLTLDSISLQQVGVRAQSVGDDREGSSKLTDVVPPPDGEEDLGSIAGYKYEDEDGDGGLDAGEDGVPGWGIKLYLDADDDGVADAGELFRTTATDANGAYRFNDLPAGDYIVVEDAQAGWTSTGSPELAVDLEESEDRSGVNFFNMQDTQQELGSIAGFKYGDIDGDGYLDPGEAGVAGWSVELYLDEDNDGEADAEEFVDSTATDATGAYLFEALLPGNYIVVEDTDVPGWTSIAPTQHEVSLGEGDDVTGVNFFNQPPPDNGGEGGENDWSSVLNYVSNFDLSGTSTVDNFFESTAYVDHTVYTDVNLDGNIAEANVDVQAFGENSLTKLDMVVWTQADYSSSIQVHAYSATDDATPIVVPEGAIS